MVKPVSLSDPAFEALRSEKQENESDSDVVLRLVREARAARRDPRRFVRNARHRERSMSDEEQTTFLQRMDQADREKARQLWEEQHGGA